LVVFKDGFWGGLKGTRWPAVLKNANDTRCRGGTGNRENVMEERKLEVIQKLEAKGISIAKAAEAIEFDPTLLSLYLVKDAYPVPNRILDKIEKAVLN
jgi:hypothetical protein